MTLSAVQHYPKIVSKLYDEHKMSQPDALGHVQHLGASGGRVPADGVFGKPSARESEPCVGELIRGWYRPEEQQPDADLGKSLREGWRNLQPEGRVRAMAAVLKKPELVDLREVETACSALCC